MNVRILVVDDEQKMGVIVGGALTDWGHEVVAVNSGRDALARLGLERFDLLLTDLKMAPPDGFALLEEARRRCPDMAVILMTAYASAATAVQAMRLGADDYLIKPFELDELRHRVERLGGARALKADVHRLSTENALLTARVQEQFSFDRLIGRSPAMQDVFSLAEAVAGTESTVLLRGETGTGKGLLARALHARSARAAGPFVKVNCGALPENLLESELFGHEKGAFTGAVARRPGRFLAAAGGTIFLDEIGEMSMSLQVKLLQVLEERTFMPVGSDTPVRADVRIITATHRPLEQMVTAGDFRQDLYFRLNVFPIVLPPLRDRRGDIPLLIEEALARQGRARADLSGAAFEALGRHAFPGNVRELENMIERAVILSRGGPIGLDHFPGIAPAPARVGGATGFALPEEGVDLELIEADFIRQSLERTGGNKTRAARLLGMTRRTLYSRMERHGIPLDEVRPGDDGPADDAPTPDGGV